MAAGVPAFIGLGANLGDAAATIEWALQRLAALPGVQLVRRSALYRSAPVDAAGPDFINAVAELKCLQSAPVLLEQLQKIEQEAGRERPYRNAPRTLDLDLLLYGDQRMDTPTLTVPHPRMHLRAFVLRPLQEIAPQLVTPAQLAAVTSQVIARMTP